MTDPVVVDVGGSGARFAEVGPNRDLRDRGKRDINSIAEFVDAIRAISPTPKAVAVSTTGFVNSATGVVSSSRAAPWAQGHLAAILSDKLGGGPVYVMNDGEAHALAILATPGVEFGAIAVALGTGLGFGVIGSDRRIVRPCSGENWDLSDVSLKTRAPRSEVWYALGSDGLQELQDSRGSRSEGSRHFGYRLGTFLGQLTVIFQPRSIVLSGGIIREHWDEMASGVDDCMRACLRDDLQPKLIRSPFAETALRGAQVALDSPSIFQC